MDGGAGAGAGAVGGRRSRSRSRRKKGEPVISGHPEVVGGVGEEVVDGAEGGPPGHLVHRVLQVLVLNTHHSPLIIFLTEPSFRKKKGKNKDH